MGGKFKAGKEPEKGKRTSLRRLVTELWNAFKPETERQEEAWKTELKGKLFRCEREWLVSEMLGSERSVLFVASLLTGKDYRLSAGVALGNAAEAGASLSVAEPYLVEGLGDGDKNVRCLCAKALTFHHLNYGEDSRRVRELAESGDMFIQREVFDSIGVYAVSGKKAAIRALAEILAHQDPVMRDRSFSMLELAIETGTDESRDGIREAMLTLQDTSGVANLLSYRSAAKLLSSIESREKRQV